MKKHVSPTCRAAESVEGRRMLNASSDSDDALPESNSPSLSRPVSILFYIQLYLLVGFFKCPSNIHNPQFHMHTISQ